MALAKGTPSLQIQEPSTSGALHTGGAEATTPTVAPYEGWNPRPGLARSHSQHPSLKENMAQTLSPFSKACGLP